MVNKRLKQIINGLNAKEENKNPETEAVRAFRFKNNAYVSTAFETDKMKKANGDISKLLKIS